MSRGGCYGLTNADWLISPPAAQILPGLLRRMAKIKETERVRIPSVPAFFFKSQVAWLVTQVHARSTFPQSFQGSLGVVRPLGASRLGAGLAHTPLKWLGEPLFLLHISKRKSDRWYSPVEITSSANLSLKALDPPPPWFEFFVVFDIFAPWYGKRWEASSVKMFIKKFKGNVGQMCYRSCSLALGFYTKLYTKSAVSESSIALRRLNLTFLPLRLSLWNLAHLFIMFMAPKVSRIFLNFV